MHHTDHDGHTAPETTLTSTLLFEVGCEELPTSFLDGALTQWRSVVPEVLSAAKIEHGAVKVYGTARRLAIVVEGLCRTVASQREELLGPPESAAKGPDGRWSRAAEGFAKKNGLSLDALAIVETPRGRYVGALRETPAVDVVTVLPGVLTELCKKLSFAKSMRWGSGDTAFGRPVQWLLALLDDVPIELEFAGVHSGVVTYGHRFLSPAALTLTRASEYVSVLERAKVMADPEARRAKTLELLHGAASTAGGTLVHDAFLEREVVGLVEWPHVVTGAFAQSFLALPEVLIEDVMRVHQRYFAVRASERLLPVFLTVTNTAEDPLTIAKGNERVMRARLTDAAFFVEQDRKTTLGSRVASLDAVVFHPKLGSYGDKVRRVAALGRWLAQYFSADSTDVSRAAALCKADLVSLTVGEFPDLQGHMGEWLARHDGESERVAVAVAEHYRPRSANDPVAVSEIGAVVAVADRVDTLVGCLAVGLKPTGSEDPFGLRRQALGVLRTLLAQGARVSLTAMVTEALRGYRDAVKNNPTERWAVAFSGAALDDSDTVRAVTGFCAERLKTILEEDNGRDAVAAAMGARHDDAVDVRERAQALAAFWKTPSADDLAVAFRRVFNISREAPEGAIGEDDRARLVHPAEVALVTAFEQTREGLAEKLSQRDYSGAMELIARTLRGPVDTFFSEVFVMAEDQALRASRLRLLGRIADAVGAFARFDVLE